MKFEKEVIKENALSHRKIRTVQHFCSSGLQKYCTVPKFFVSARKNLGTVQHFCPSGLQKCCTVPKLLVPGHKNLRTVQHFAIQRCKSAVLSLNFCVQEPTI